MAFLEQFGKYVGVGALATIIQYAILFLLVEYFAVDPVVASSIGYIISAGVNYLLNYHLTFSSQASHSSAIAKFVLVAAIGLLINSICMYFLQIYIFDHYVFSQIVATSVVLVWNFSINRKWTYKSV